MTRPILFALIASAAVTTTAQSPLPPAPEIAARIQKKYETVRDFSASFTHQHEGGALRRKYLEQGTVYVKKPGRMRWEYSEPEKKLFVADGTRLYDYDPESNQVTVADLPQGDAAASPALFLAGRGNIVRDFEVSHARSTGEGVYALRLEPKRPQDAFDWLELVVDRRTLELRSLTAVEAQGARSTFVFTSLKENVGLADKMFEFRIPRGAEVIHAGRGKR
jgi:outer membrane lipoprotein carrier protein